MPIIEDDDMVDRAVYWEANGWDDEGKPAYEAPVEIYLNYRQRRSSSIGADGTTMTLDGQASTLELLTLESKIWVAPSHLTSALTQWYASGSAGQTDEVMRVATVNKIRDAKEIETRYTAGLQWFRDQPDEH